VAACGLDRLAGRLVQERQVAAAIEWELRQKGFDKPAFDTIVASGPNSRPILARSTFRTIAEEDMVLLTIAPRVQGYHAAIGRPVFVGETPAVVEAAFDAACRAQDACAAALRPGIEGRAVEKIGRDIMHEAGFGEFFLYSGVHSVGVIEFEPPIFGPSSSAVLAENMIISIDIPVFNAPWGGLRIEDGYLITATGAEHLHATPYLLQK
jgi:Xaa-Pro aminopeptidase